jgi:hypothetical protein
VSTHFTRDRRSGTDLHAHQVDVAAEGSVRVEVAVAECQREGRAGVDARERRLDHGADDAGWLRVSVGWVLI